MTSDNDVTVFRPGGITYVHIPARDAQQSAAFYETVFGWDIRGDPTRPSFSDSTGHVIGAWVTDIPVVGHGGVLLYVYVNDVEHTLTTAQRHGGAVVQPPYPEGDRTVATSRDPAGTVLGVWDPGHP